MSSFLLRTVLTTTALGISVASMGASGAATQQHGMQAQRSDNLRATQNLRARISATTKRISEGKRSGAVPHAGAAVLQRQVAQTQASMGRLSRRQGFVSAGELASYNRTLGAIDVELDRLGVARSYDNDMLVTPVADAWPGEFRYDCQNKQVAIAIPGDRLERSLEQLRLATHCPISGTDLARGRRSQPVVGTMTPTAALQAMLNRTGLQMRTIKGGYQIIRLPR